MKKIISALDYTLIRLTGIFFLFCVICIGLYILFLVCGLIEYHWGFLDSSYYIKGENLAKSLPSMSLSICFLTTLLIYYKAGYKDIVVRKLRCMTALRMNMWLWRNFYGVLLVGCLLTFGFDDWLYYEIRDNLAFFIVNLALFIIFCVFGKCTQSTYVKTEKQEVVETILKILGTVALSGVSLYVSYLMVRYFMRIFL